MPQFRYRGVTQTGALVVGDVKASSREQVPQRIECLGHWPIEVVPQFEPVFRDLGIQPNAGAALVLAASDWLHHNEELSLGTVLIATLDLVPATAVRMHRVGGETGDLASIAKQAARFYEHRLGIGLDRLTGAIGPARIIIVSMVLGSLILSSMSALLSITEPAL